MLCCLINQAFIIILSPIIGLEPTPEVTISGVD